MTQQESYAVRGTSMQAVLAPGEAITLLRDYYHCRPVERGDWVVFRYQDSARQPRSIIKQALGLPGDKLGMANQTEHPLPVIQINDQTVRAPNGKPYFLDKVSRSYLGLALRQTKDGIIPRGRYWVLGTEHSGGWDSRRFGFIPHQDLLGKAVLSKQNKQENSHEQSHPTAIVPTD